MFASDLRYKNYSHFQCLQKFFIHLAGGGGVERQSPRAVQFNWFLMCRYRKLALQHHPEKNEGDQVAAETFLQIAEAYDVLSDGT